MRCKYCGHDWCTHHTLATSPLNADGKPNPPKGAPIPCDVVMANGEKCGCARWWAVEAPTPDCPGCIGTGYHSDACYGGWGPNFGDEV
jgi:hypothetical protein